MTWNDTFLTLFDRCVAAYRSGNRDFGSYYGPADLAFLAEIGCRTREFFDFVEDFCDEGVPSATTALLMPVESLTWTLAFDVLGPVELDPL